MQPVRPNQPRLRRIAIRITVLLDLCLFFLCTYFGESLWKLIQDYKLISVEGFIRILCSLIWLFKNRKILLDMFVNSNKVNSENVDGISSN